MRTELVDATKVSLKLETEVLAHHNDIDADVIFIHGLGGGSQTTWAYEQDVEKFWPDWLARSFPNLNIWTMGYSSSISAWVKDSMPLEDLGDTILEEMVACELGSRPIIFITHSLGGLVAKQLIIHAFSQDVPRWELLGEKVLGVSFIATPHAGANLASFANFFSLLLNTSEQVSALQHHSSQLNSLHTAFLKVVSNRKMVCRAFAERQKIKPGITIPFFNHTINPGVSFLVVDPTSAEPRIPHEKAIPLEEDHISICKPVNREATLYKSHCLFLQECLNLIQNPS
ncbi:triacylglycerol lipase [Acaryochloris marina]|uniref:esterase/lipase family protein n=1 Tax=Acaryochloris marina TaxID=155978 RepID=UPI001BB057D9|nr:alpha/beta fold hydrolase [Acaryochloris marina]QUY41898.1 alpha/beta fold hydrolase [Acaryochloris marina S15]